jgi:hypothetical protein
MDVVFRPRQSQSESVADFENTKCRLNAMPQFTRKEIRILLIIGLTVLAVGVIMMLSGAYMLKNSIGAPEYVTSLRNSGVTLSILALLWTGLAGFRKSQLR